MIDHQQRAAGERSEDHAATVLQFPTRRTETPAERIASDEEMHYWLTLCRQQLEGSS